MLTDSWMYLCRRSSLPFCMTTSQAIDGAESAKRLKVVNYLMTSGITGGRRDQSKKPVFSRRGFQQKPSAEMDLSTEVATRLKLVDQETPATGAPETHSINTAHQRYSGEGIPRLTKVRLIAMSQIRCWPFILFFYSNAFNECVCRRWWQKCVALCRRVIPTLCWVQLSSYASRRGTWPRYRREAGSTMRCT